MVMNQLSHQESGTANLQKFTSNPRPLLPKPILLFQLSWGDLIIMKLIMVMLVFTFHSIHLNIPMNLFRIWTPLQLNQLMMLKWNNSCNHSTQSMMIIFWMLTSRCFNIDRWFLIIKIYIQSLLCCLINMEEKTFLSQISCHTFLCLSQPRPL